MAITSFKRLKEIYGQKFIGGEVLGDVFRDFRKTVNRIERKHPEYYKKYLERNTLALRMFVAAFIESPYVIISLSEKYYKKREERGKPDAK